MFKSNKILALDIGASKVVLAEFGIKKGEVPELLSYGISNLGYQETDTQATSFIVTAIRDIMKDNNIQAAPLLMTISGQSVFPRFVKLPAVSKDKIPSMVQYEAEQNVPFPMSEVVWDYQLIENPESGEMHVMLVAVKMENVSRLTDCVVAANLEPDIVDVAPMALYNTVRFNYPDIEGCTMVLDIGARSSNLIFIEEEKIFSRSIPVAGNTITQELMKEFDVPFNEAEQMKLSHAFVAFGGVYAGPDSEVSDRVSKIVRNVITRLHAEVNRSINFYRSQQGGTAPSLILLTGGSSIIPHTDTFFREKLQVQVEYLNPFNGIAVSAGVDAEAVAQDAHLLGEVVGLALRKSLECPIEVNLMPKILKDKKIMRARQPFFAIAGIGLVLMMFCWWVYYYKSRGIWQNLEKDVKSSLEEHTNRQSIFEKSVKNKAVAEAKFKQLETLIQRRTQWIEMIRAIHDCLTDGMWLLAIQPLTPDNGETVTGIEIIGRGFIDKMSNKEGQPSAVEQFQARLNAQKDYFTENTKIDYESSPRASDYARDYKMIVFLKKPILMADLTINPSTDKAPGRQGAGRNQPSAASAQPPADGNPVRRLPPRGAPVEN